MLSGIGGSTTEEEVKERSGTSISDNDWQIAAIDPKRTRQTARAVCVQCLFISP